jgi:hypothetical protein
MRKQSFAAAGAVLLTAFVLNGIAGSPALAHTNAHVSAGTYSGKAISFSYPAGWKVLPASEAKSLGGSFVSAAKGFTVNDVAGVSKKAGQGGAIVVVLKASFSKKVAGQVHGHHKAFMTGFVNGLAGTKGMKILGKKSTTLGGQPAQTVDVLQTGKSPNRQEYSVAISGDEKSIYLALYLTTPDKLWKTYGSIFPGIAKSIRFR